MEIRYVQAAVSKETHKAITWFVCQHELTIGELIETAVLEYIKRKEAEQSEVDAVKEKEGSI